MIIDEIVVGSRWCSNSDKAERLIRHVEGQNVCYWNEEIQTLYVCSKELFLRSYKLYPIIDQPGWYLKRNNYPIFVLGKHPFEDRWIATEPTTTTSYRSDGRLYYGREPDCLDIVRKLEGNAPTSFKKIEG